MQTIDATRRRSGAVAFLLPVFVCGVFFLFGVGIGGMGRSSNSNAPAVRAGVAPTPSAKDHGSSTPADKKVSDAPITEPRPESRERGIDYLGLKAVAEDKLRSVLTDTHGVRYREVSTQLSTLDGGGVVAFCGQVNSRTPFGGYSGFRRFIASQRVATTEDQMSSDDFSQAWSHFCTDGVAGPKVWF